MATLSQASQVLPGWGYYLSGNQFDNVDNKYAQDFLSSLHQYDPNARFQQVESVLGNGGEGGGGGQDAYELVYDQSKLPGGGPSGVDMNAGGYAGFRQDPNAGYAGHLYNSDAITQDPNGYGRVTSPRNLDLARDNYSAIGQWGPAIIAAIATLGAAAPALMAGNGLFSSLSGAATLGTRLAGAIPSFGQAVSSGNPLAAIGSVAPALGGMAGINPSLTSGAISLARLAQQAKQPGG